MYKTPRFTLAFKSMLRNRREAAVLHYLTLLYYCPEASGRRDPVHPSCIGTVWGIGNRFLSIWNKGISCRNERRGSIRGGIFCTPQQDNPAPSYTWRFLTFLFASYGGGGDVCGVSTSVLLICSNLSPLSYSDCSFSKYALINRPILKLVNDQMTSPQLGAF